MDDCVFCNIANKSMQADIIIENDELMVFRDILPKAPVHLLVIPKKHIGSANELTEADKSLAGAMVLAGQEAARKQGVGDSGYKMVFNVGKEGGQVVPHLHMHVLGGKQLDG